MKHFSTMMFAVLIIASFTACESVPDGVGDGVDNVKEGAEASTEKATSGSDESDSSGSSAGLSEEDEQKLEYVDRAREKCPVDDGARPWSEEDERLTDKRAAVRTCETQLENRKADLEELDPQTKGHPRFKKAQKYVDTLDQKIPKWHDEVEEMMAEQSADRERFNEYKEFFGRDQRLTIERLWEFKSADDPSVEAKTFQIEQWVDAGVTLDDKESKCRDRFDIDKEYTSYKDDEAMQPNNACDVVYNWRDYMTSFIAHAAGNRAEEHKKELEEWITELKEKGLIKDDRRAALDNLEGQEKELLKKYQEFFDQMEVEITDEVTGNMNTDFAELKPKYEEAFETAVETERWNMKGLYKEKKVEKPLKERFSDRDYSVLDYGVGGKDWMIERDGMGNPVARKHNGKVVLQKDDEDFCRIYNFQAKAQYDGNNYGKAKIIATNSPSQRELLTPSTSYYRISSCP